MQADIGIGMAFKPHPMGNAHAAKPNMVADRKSVDVEAGSGSDLAERSGCNSFGDFKITRMGKLYVCFLS